MSAALAELVADLLHRDLLASASPSLFPSDESLLLLPPGLHVLLDNARGIQASLDLARRLPCGAMRDVARAVSLDVLAEDLTISDQNHDTELRMEKLVLEKHAWRLAAVRRALGPVHLGRIPWQSVVLVARMSREHHALMYPLYKVCVEKITRVMDERFQSSDGRESPLSLDAPEEVADHVEALLRPSGPRLSPGPSLHSAATAGFVRNESIESIETRVASWLRSRREISELARATRRRDEVLALYADFPDLRLAAVPDLSESATRRLLSARWFMTELTDTKQLLQSDYVRRARSLRGTAAAGARLLEPRRARLVFVTSVEQYCVHAAHAAREELVRELRGARRESRVVEAHEAFLYKLCRACFCESAETSTLRGLILKILRVARESATAEEATRGEEFRAMARFLLQSAGSGVLREWVELGGWTW